MSIEISEQTFLFSKHQLVISDKNKRVFPLIIPIFYAKHRIYALKHLMY